MARERDFLRIRAERRTNAVDFIRGDGHADAASAHQDAAIGRATRHITPDGRGEIGIVDRRGAFSAVIGDLVTGCAEDVAEVVLQNVTRMIRAKGDFHGNFDFTTRARLRRRWARVRLFAKWIYDFDAQDAAAVLEVFRVEMHGSGAGGGDDDEGIPEAEFVMRR